MVSIDEQNQTLDLLRTKKGTNARAHTHVYSFVVSNPRKNMKVSWDDYSQYGKHRNMFQTTHQHMYVYKNNSPSSGCTIWEINTPSGSRCLRSTTLLSPVAGATARVVEEAGSSWLPWSTHTVDGRNHSPVGRW